MSESAGELLFRCGEILTSKSSGKSLVERREHLMSTFSGESLVKCKALPVPKSLGKSFFI